MKFVLVINFLVLISIAFGKPKHEDPHLAEDDPDMQNDEYVDYEDDSNDDGDDEEDVTPEILSKGQVFVVNKHENVSLPCDMVGNNVVVTMWKKKDSIIFQDKIQLGSFNRNKYSLINNTSLFVRDVDENDVGEYSCNLVMNENSPRIVHVIKLTTPATILNINANKNTNEYKTGDTLELTCNATGNPEPKITWSIAGKRMTTTGRTLIVDKLARDNAGVYQCLAENHVGSPAHQSIHIKINHKPIVHIEKVITFNDGEDYNVELKCLVDSHPKAIVTWRKDGEVLPEALYKLRNKNTIHSVTITHVKESDYGKFTCEAENQVGRSERHYLLTDKPSQPVYKSGEQIDNDRAVYLVWEVESLYPISEHLLMYRRKDATEWMQDHPEVTNGVRSMYTINHTISSLEHGEYVAKVKSKNRSGWSEESKETKFSGPKHKQHHENKKNHYVYNKANEHNIQEAPEQSQTLLEETDSSTMIAPTSLIYLIVLTLFNRLNV